MCKDGPREDLHLGSRGAITAREPRDLLWDLDASDAEAKPCVSALEAALKDAHTRNISLEEGLQARLAELDSLRDTVATQAAELNFLRESLKSRPLETPPGRPSCVLLQLETLGRSRSTSPRKQEG